MTTFRSAFLHSHFSLNVFLFKEYSWNAIEIDYIVMKDLTFSSQPSSQKGVKFTQVPDLLNILEEKIRLAGKFHNCLSYQDLKFIRRSGINIYGQMTMSGLPYEERIINKRVWP